jgi:YesN/AraC family two-component response regulator
MISFDLVNFPKAILIGRRICASDWEYSPYVLQNYEFMFIYQGEAILSVDGVTRSLFPGDVILLMPNQVFSSRTHPDNPCRYYIVHFKVDNPVEILSEELASAQISQAIQSMDYSKINDAFEMPQINFKRIYLSVCLSLGASRVKIFNLLEKAIVERNQLNLSSEIMMSCCLSEIMIQLSRLTIENLKIDIIFNHANEMPRTIQEAVYFIHDNFSRQISLRDICKYMEVSPQYLIRIFNKKLNRSPLQYLNMFRVSRAKDMLKYTPLSIKEISYEIGIQNPFYFCRLFKKIEGMTPSEFRKKEQMLISTV